MDGAAVIKIYQKGQKREIAASIPHPMLIENRIKKEEEAVQQELTSELARPLAHKQKYEPTEAELCQAVVLLKKVMPNRSLERAITLMHEILNKHTPLELVFDKPPSPPTEVSKTFEKNTLLKTSFANQQQELRYKEKRLVAKSFVGKGYGLQFALDEFTQAKFHSPLTKDNYKRVIAAVVTQAFRKLESFLSQDCAKPITPLSKEEMAKIMTPLLSSTHFGQHVPVFKKFLRLLYGLSKVVLCEGETVSFYEAVLKQIRGSNSQAPEHAPDGKQDQAKGRKRQANEFQRQANGFERQANGFQRQVNEFQRQANEFESGNPAEQKSRENHQKYTNDKAYALDNSQQKLQHDIQSQNWNEQLDSALMSTYLTHPSAAATLQVLKPTQPSFYSLQKIRTRLLHLVHRALVKLQNDQSLQLQPPKASQQQLHFIAKSKQALKVRAGLLRYLQERYSSQQLGCALAVEINELLAKQKSQSEEWEAQMDQEESAEHNESIYEGSEYEVKQESANES